MAVVRVRPFGLPACLLTGFPPRAQLPPSAWKRVVAVQSERRNCHEKDNPQSTPPHTTQRAFSRCDAGHPPLFTVNPGICAHDALVHVAQYLRGAYDCGYKALEHLDETGKSLFWSNLNAVEMAEGLGQESQC